MNERTDRVFDDEHCQCERPVWKIGDYKHCARCGKLLPDVKTTK